MQIAIVDGQRVVPNKTGMVGVCPLCGSDVMSKCGNKVLWHWAHKNVSDCDKWGENESDWHIGWKNHFPEECREVVINNHRADAAVTIGEGDEERTIYFEFQKSPMTLDEIRERTLFYTNVALDDRYLRINDGRMVNKLVWVVDISEWKRTVVKYYPKSRKIAELHEEMARRNNFDHDHFQERIRLIEEQSDSCGISGLRQSWHDFIYSKHDMEWEVMASKTKQGKPVVNVFFDNGDEFLSYFDVDNYALTGGTQRKFRYMTKEKFINRIKELG